MRCEVSGNCKLQKMVQEMQTEEMFSKKERGSVAHPEHNLYDHTSPSIVRDMSKCIECGLCIDACAAQHIVSYFTSVRAIVCLVLPSVHWTIISYRC